MVVFIENASIFAAFPVSQFSGKTRFHTMVEGIVIFILLRTKNKDPERQ